MSLKKLTNMSYYTTQFGSSPPHCPPKRRLLPITNANPNSNPNPNANRNPT